MYTAKIQPLTFFDSGHHPSFYFQILSSSARSPSVQRWSICQTALRPPTVIVVFYRLSYRSLFLLPLVGRIHYRTRQTIGSNSRFRRLCGSDVTVGKTNQRRKVCAVSCFKNQVAYAPEKRRTYAAKQSLGFRLVPIATGQRVHHFRFINVPADAVNFYIFETQQLSRFSMALDVLAVRTL
ncbi:hypothetical protein L596_003407 [Steinernema carpocapsae]|uniref:Uncharacterized protein n=1 Tax=Steinernema carpocapsae TaxID=34508 RepID=A0A4V6YSW2_STECR|nr:hypothetical protein L596_003407 [Steinernema carpocapsae]